MRKMFNFIHKLNWIQLGALNGLIFGFTLLIILCFINIYLDWLDSTFPERTINPCSGTTIRFIDWTWTMLFLPLITLILGIITGYLGRIMLNRKPNSKFLTMMLFGLIFFGVIWLCGATSDFIMVSSKCPNFLCNDKTFIEYLIPHQQDLPLLAGLFLIILVFNFFFSLALSKYGNELR